MTLRAGLDEISRLRHLVETQRLINSAGHVGMRLEQACARADRAGTPLVVFLLDLDGFKAVNDRYGHHCGDVVLRRVADHLRAALRQQDTLARLGGDEFVIVCEGATEEDSYSILSRVYSAVSQVAASGPEFAGVAASVGMARRGDDGLSPDEVLAAADASMYRVKKAGVGPSRLKERGPGGSRGPG